MRAPKDLRPLKDRVRIVGGGLTGIRAAFEAHRLGWRDITLRERFETLGGDARPKVIHGREMRDRPVHFSAPIVETLTAHGARFETVDNRLGSLCVSADGHRVFTWDFAGPAIDCPAGKVSRPADDSLAARLAAYPPIIAVTLEAYVRWRLEIDPAQLHADAALPLAIDRVFPAAADLPALAQARASDPWAEALYGIPSNLDEAATATASLPVGGSAKLFDGLHKVLTRLGVKVELNRLVSPGELMAEARAGETIVWAADPTCLFKPMGVTPPARLDKCVFTYVFEVERFDGPRPVQVNNFTAQGAVFAAHLYESGGATLVAAACVREADFNTLPTELRTLLSGFGRLKLGPMVHGDVQSRPVPSLAAAESLALLRDQLAARFGGRFVLADASAKARNALAAPVLAKAS
jgi:hypothetical protein